MCHDREVSSLYVPMRGVSHTYVFTVCIYICMFIPSFPNLLCVYIYIYIYIEFQVSSTSIVWYAPSQVVEPSPGVPAG